MTPLGSRISVTLQLEGGPASSQVEERRGVSCPEAFTSLIVQCTYYLLLNTENMTFKNIFLNFKIFNKILLTLGTDVQLA